MHQPALFFHDEQPTFADFKEEVLQGLRRSPKHIPPKFFYDKRGSQLFDAICELPEYYPTRTEISILKDHAIEIARTLGKNRLLIELGSGSSHKVRLLLEALRPTIYMPLDISKEHLLASAKTLAADYPWMKVHALCVDYSQGFRLPSGLPDTKKIVFFPGSSIGNFEPSTALDFLRNLARLLQPEEGLLIGVDLKKDPAILNRAYNDSQNITAQFNLNLLRRINRELRADFALHRFHHRAFYNEAEGRIEMHLVSDSRQQVMVAGERFHFEPQESIHSENSYKYSIEEFQSLAQGAGFQAVKAWTDPRRLFSVHYFCL